MWKSGWGGLGGQYCGRCSAEVERRRNEAGGVTGSGLGHGTGLLVIDVAAHTASVHTWRDHRGAAEGKDGVINGGGRSRWGSEAGGGPR